MVHAHTKNCMLLAIFLNSHDQIFLSIKKFDIENRYPYIKKLKSPHMSAYMIYEPHVKDLQDRQKEVRFTKAAFGLIK